MTMTNTRIVTFVGTQYASLHDTNSLVKLTIKILLDKGSEREVFQCLIWRLNHCFANVGLITETQQHKPAGTFLSDATGVSAASLSDENVGKLPNLISLWRGAKKKSWI